MMRSASVESWMAASLPADPLDRLVHAGQVLRQGLDAVLLVKERGIEVLAHLVDGEVDVYRSPPAHLAYVPRLADRVREPLDVQDPEAVLGDGHQQAVRVDLLERPLSEGSGGDLPGESYHRHGVRVCGSDASDEVRGAGSAGRQTDSGYVLRPRVSVRHVGGALLVPDQDVPDVGVEQLVVDGQDASTGVSEYGVGASLLQHAKERFRASH